MNGRIVNVRGAPGSGKTELARRVMDAYGWRRGTPAGERMLPGYLLPAPSGGRPLAVLGCYGRSSGGCDTVSLRDGGLDAVFEAAAGLAADGCDVLMEGLALAEEQARSCELAALATLHVLHLTTPADECGARLARRRRRPIAEAAALRRLAVDHADRIAAAVDRLRPVATVHAGRFDVLLDRALVLLAADTRGAEAA